VLPNLPIFVRPNGHGTFIFPTPDRNNMKLFDLLKKANIPIELCLTSNVVCQTVKDFESHQIGLVLENKLPFAICTDDPGVFETSLSNEFAIASQTFNITIADLWRYSFKTIDYSFATPVEKLQLKSMWIEEWGKSGFQHDLS